MHVLINERSFEEQASNRHHADTLMKDLIYVVKGLKSIQGKDPIHTSRMLWQAELLPGYNVHQWLKNIRQSRKEEGRKDLVRWLYMLVTKEPFIETILDQELVYHECRFQGQDVSSSSLAGAAFYGGILTSLQHSENFNDSCLKVEYREDEGTFEELEIHNAYNPDTVGNFVKGIQQTLSCEVSSWETFWNQKEQLFPNLSFCSCVYEQL